MKTQVADLTFELSIPYSSIEKRVTEIATHISNDYSGRVPVMVGILSGSFLFLADLVKQIEIPIEVTFAKLASYYGGTSTTRKIRDDFDLTIDIKGRDIILVEDIVDTGNTIHYLIEKLKVREPGSVTVCTLLLKPKALERAVPELKYTGFELPNDFVVGYGLDYKELGRNLKGIFKKVG
ncbi:hypoxanthine phosphoribosyltransferase [Mucilaginibacter sp. BT774]|uniref:hypoxanthine phosphoribosyltransferase n=1 Tax=Mucilaginibacter sp. BT774 TaxID=3062276 RepID=UPI002677179C|nr:hypoxanthine phosphoribosyltransferase [Mucilaginibacter sp. BT774]MDO3628425.1 hypoxanthine phosphoribosyltransferase [Mucilaginibacter sp. BT774]